jgi:hypothetical protein
MPQISSTLNISYKIRRRTIIYNQFLQLKNVVYNYFLVVNDNFLLVQRNDATTLPYHLTILKEQYLHNNTNAPIEVSHGPVLNVDLFD